MITEPIPEFLKVYVVTDEAKLTEISKSSAGRLDTSGIFTFVCMSLLLSMLVPLRVFSAAGVSAGSKINKRL